MMIQAYDRENDPESFLRFYNEQIKYAPFSVPLTKRYLQEYVLTYTGGDAFLYVSKQGDAVDGIIHFGLCPGNKKIGDIYLLMGASTQICMALLSCAERFFSNAKTVKIQCFPWKPNPYQFFLYGVEAYCWAGLYTANNAFRRMHYDVTLDIVVMSFSLKDWKEKEEVFSSVVIKEEILLDDSVALQGRLVAYDEACGRVEASLPESGRTDGSAGHSGYYELKAVSGHLGKKYGQIDIWIHENHHGKHVGHALMEAMHKRLFFAGVDTVILATNQALFRAIKFYEKLGYRTETIRGYCYGKACENERVYEGILSEKKIDAYIAE